MKIVVAPDKFKGSLTAAEAASAIAEGVRAAIPGATIDLCPIADGGEGTVSAIVQARGGRIITRRVTGPLPEMKVDASFALLDDGITAVVEMAAASGLALLAMEDRNPLNTTTFGTGELIAAAIREGAKKILVGMGGSATVDSGIGMLQALGFTILTRDGEPNHFTEPLCGRDLSNVLMVKHGRGEITGGIGIVGLADVFNPLSGPTGAARTFGPQKGASAEEVDWLDAQLTSLAVRTGNQEFATQPGTGAAGGLGFGVLAYLGGSLIGGFDFIAQSIKLRERLADADLCITGEGRLDSQTAHGKGVMGVARLCRETQAPCIALAGSVGENVESLTAEGLTCCFCICDSPMTLADAMTNAKRLLIRTAMNCVALWTAG